MSQTPPLRIFTSLVVLSVAALIFAGILFNEIVLERIDPNPPLLRMTVSKIRRIQLGFLLTGGTIALLFVWMKVSGRLASLNRNERATRALLLAVLVIQPGVMLDFMLSSLLESKTLLFIPDEDLGWRLKPLARDTWGNVPVSINAKGLRGPELDYSKSANDARQPSAKRVLYLGDSVTFGYGVEGYENTFPYQTEAFLEQSTGLEIETINAGVGGYSPWQQLRFLESEGIRYGPDLIVVSFVLNDVTEKLSLTRFGGWSDGYQLNSTSGGKIERLLMRSGLYKFGRKIYGRLQFGSDVQQGAAAAELATVRQLAEEPDSPRVREAWQITLANLRALVRYARERQVPVLLAVFPFTFQFEDPEAYSAPQQVLIEFAKEEEIPVVDLLPRLAVLIEERGSSTEEYFWDGDHLTALGCRQVGRILAREIERQLPLDVFVRPNQSNR